MDIFGDSWDPTRRGFEPMLCLLTKNVDYEVTALPFELSTTDLKILNLPIKLKFQKQSFKDNKKLGMLKSPQYKNCELRIQKAKNKNNTRKTLKKR